ncbi:hypothetical protein BV25DRAFT_1842665 [Artomyces pyxidatus]|uniref:Uncharacterized protein n=1 Tax=Artomyces pyxidatus TaxID=48021 RepID=A0ACB8SI31_9AGAM|nr:hypothetical protein BV25DRAFT_1842665 [Artomyces pyxidatus]
MQNNGLKRTIIKSPDLWLSDGNIIVRALTGKSEILYRVHKSVLSMHSNFFEATFGEQGSDSALDTGSDHFEGVPILDMPGDDANDIRQFLMALYIPQFSPKHREIGWDDSQFDFPGQYAGTLRLSTKYIVPDLRKMIVQKFHARWPCLLEQWDLEEGDLASLQEANTDSWPSKFDIYPDPARTIRLAVDHDIPEVLPVAFYDLARLFEHYDSTGTARSADLGLLTADDLRRLARGRGALRREFASMIENPFRCSVPPNCAREVEVADLEEDPWAWACKAGLLRWWKSAFVDRFFDASADPVAWLAQAIKDSDMLFVEVCPECGVYMKDLICRRREQLWLDLPTFFDVTVSPEWGLDNHPYY